MMNQEIQEDEVTIDLMELFSALWAKKTIIILSAVFMALVAFVGTKMFVTPKYTSVTKLFVMTKNDDTSASATYTDFFCQCNIFGIAVRKHVDEGLYGIGKKPSGTGEGHL